MKKTELVVFENAGNIGDICAWAHVTFIGKCTPRKAIADFVRLPGQHTYKITVTIEEND